MKYDQFFLDLFLLVPPMDASTTAPPSKPSLQPTFSQAVATLTRSSASPDEIQQALQTLRAGDCEEAFAAMVTLFKSETAPASRREAAIDLLYECSRGRYNGITNHIRLLLLESVMKLLVRFALSSLPVGARWGRDVAAAAEPRQRDASLLDRAADASPRQADAGRARAAAEPRAVRRDEAALLRRLHRCVLLVHPSSFLRRVP